MFARRLLVMGLMCGSLLLGTAHVAHAKACQCGQDYSVTTPHDTPFNLDVDVVLGDFRLDHIEIGDSPQHGTATVIAPVDSDGRIHYVPDPGFVGQDALTFVPVDGNGDTGGAGRVHITVTGPAPTTTTTTEPATTTTTVAAAGSTIPASTAPTTVAATATTVAAAAAPLPRTGSTSGGLAALAGGFIVAGAAAVAVSRRRVRVTRR